MNRVALQMQADDALPVTVIPVTEPPRLKNPHVTRGLETVENAKRWAAKMGASVVYYNKREQKAYCPRIAQLPEMSNA